MFLTARLGVPLALGEMGWMSTYLVDALMIGKLPHSALSIAASSLGNTIFSALAFCAIALLTGLQTLAAQAFGRSDEDECHRLLIQSLWIDIALVPLVMGLTVFSVFALRWFHTPEAIVEETDHYLRALVWSTAPLLFYWTLRRYLQSLNRIAFILVSLVTGGLVNYVADWAFLYGHLGFPRLGIAGSGWATCVVRLFALSLLVVALPRSFWRKVFTDLRSYLQLDLRRQRLLLRIGWPAAIQSFADLGVSTYLSVLCAQFGATLLAAHQIVLDLDAFVYMAPLGLSYATAVRVGQSAGRNSVSQARRAASASLILGLSYVAVAGSIFVVFSRTWASFYTTDAKVIAAAIPIFVICGVLQWGDAAGIILEAALVGVGDTRSPLIVNAIWSWVLGMPLSYFLGFRYGLSLEGLWFGRLLAAIGSALTLVMVWRLRLRGRNLSAQPITQVVGPSGLPSAMAGFG